MAKKNTNRKIDDPKQECLFCKHSLALTKKDGAIWCMKQKCKYESDVDIEKAGETE